MFLDFIGIGAQKAGTTWLSRNLQLHPQIWMPTVKEIHYFDEKIDDPSSFVPRIREKLSGERAVDYRWRRQLKARSKRHLKGTTAGKVLWDLRYFFGRPSDEWYASLFEPGRGSVVGEITPDYSVLGKESVAHVHELMPEAKIIFMMRNPIERAWSQAVMSFDRKGEDIATTEEGKLRRSFDLEGSRLRTDYLRTLENWGSFYAPEQIFVGFLEDVHFFPELLLRRLYDFLGVDESAEYRVKKRKVHSRATGKMPTSVAAYLAHSYYEDFERLHERFGGYASFWLYGAERLAKETPREGSVPYPLWESEIWIDWAGNSKAGPRPQFQSGLLASIQGA